MNRIVLLVFAATLLLAGCGDDDADQGDASTTSTTADDASGSGGDATGGPGSDGAASLDDFPIPGPPDAEPQVDNTQDGVRAVTFVLPDDRFDEIVAFYDDWVASSDDDYQRTEAEAGGVSWIGSTADGAPRQIQVSSVSGGEFVVGLIAGG